MKYSFLLCTSNSERVLTEVLESIVSQKIDHKSIEIMFGHAFKRALQAMSF